MGLRNLPLFLRKMPLCDGHPHRRGYRDKKQDGFEGLKKTGEIYGISFERSC